MEAEEKAKELIGKFTVKAYCQVTPRIKLLITLRSEQAKECALVCVDEILNLQKQTDHYYGVPYTEFSKNYWENVKTEIEKL